MKKQTFKEITSKEQLEDFFRLCYEIYSNSDNKNFIQENTNQIDTDDFDIHEPGWWGMLLQEKQMMM